MSRARCPHGCGATLTPAHVRDTGAALELPDGACPLLFERRTGRTSDTGSRRRLVDYAPQVAMLPPRLPLLVSTGA